MQMQQVQFPQPLFPLPASMAPKYLMSAQTQILPTEFLSEQTEAGYSEWIMQTAPPRLQE